MEERFSLGISDSSEQASTVYLVQNMVSVSSSLDTECGSSRVKSRTINDLNATTTSKDRASYTPLQQMAPFRPPGVV
jgi:hypothetical protein